MNTSSESIKDAVLRLFPSSSSYTSQEEDAILEFYNLFDGKFYNFLKLKYLNYKYMYSNQTSFS